MSAMFRVYTKLRQTAADLLDAIEVEEDLLTNTVNRLSNLRATLRDQTEPPTT